MPQMGVSVAEGTVVAWRVSVGDPISADETICEISTDKIDTEVPAPVSGVVAEILVAVEETVTVGTVLARIAREGSEYVPAGDDASAQRGASEAAETLSSEAAVSSEPAGVSEPAVSSEPAGATNGGGSNGGSAAATRPTIARSSSGGADRGRYSPVVQRIA